MPCRFSWLLYNNQKVLETKLGPNKCTKKQTFPDEFLQFDAVIEKQDFVKRFLA